MADLPEAKKPKLALASLCGSIVLVALFAICARTDNRASTQEPAPTVVPVPTLENVTYAIPTAASEFLSPTLGPPRTPSPPDASPSPLPTRERIEVDCSTDETAIVNESLRVGVCLPPSWSGTKDGASAASPQELERELSLTLVSPEWFPYPRHEDAEDLSPEQAERLTNTITISVYYAPPYLGFEGCTPSQSGFVSNIALFCEDTYDVLKPDEVRFSPEGARTTWKFLAPVTSRNIGGFHRDGGSVYVRVTFATSIRERAVEEVVPILSRLSIPPE